MEKRIIFATGNEGKMKEVRMILADLDMPVLSLKEAGISADIDENGTTFEENAVIKAKAIMELTGAIVLADDSGLEIDYLNKEPGIYSARYMGEDTSYQIKNQNLIDRLDGVPDEQRTARFACAIACAWPDGRVDTTYAAVGGDDRATRAGAKTALAMIPSSIFRSTAVRRQSWIRRRKMRSATGESVADDERKDERTSS